MNYKTIFITLFLFTALSTTCFAQIQNFGIQMYQPYKSEVKNCKKCKLAFSEKAKEIKFSVKRENSKLYFQVNDDKWFNSLFANTTDGLAVDIVAKGRYDCGTLVDADDQVRGLLLKPVYSNKLKSELKSIGNNKYSVMIGTIPENLRKRELEFNILFIGNKTLCRYQTIFNLQAYSWDLLDMGMYLDSISYDNKKIRKSNQDFKINNKTLRFEIPFQKINRPMRALICKHFMIL